MRQAWLAVVGALALLAILGPSDVAACQPYTLSGPDAFGLRNGVQWAAAGVVSREIENRELPGRPLAVVLTITKSIEGDASIHALRIDQDAGCDGFWYRLGDHVIAAIGNVQIGVVPARRNPLRPPFRGITNYAVAVWVIRDGRIDGHERAPDIDGRVPTTEQQLLALLAALPDTSTISGESSTTEAPISVVILSISAVLGAAIGWRRSQDASLPSRSSRS
jgi:hypothetical protein